MVELSELQIRIACFPTKTLNTEQFGMTSRKDVKSFGVEPTDPMDLSQTVEVAGRVVHDERGNAIWKWVGDTSSTGTGSGILKHIDPADLNVEGPGGQLPKSRGSAGKGSDGGGGYDPYNQTTTRNNSGAPPKKGGPGKR
jgi:hypothetical protein